jgi:glucose/arabinose dehydrogenase
MPAQWQTLDYYFKPELISGGFTGTSQNMPVKLAQAPAPDNRIFVSVLNGTILTITAAAPHTQTVWANLSVLNGAEQGLLGIALSPNFASNGFVYVQACVNNVTNKQQIIRYTDSGGVGINPVVIMDNLPTGNIHNSGALKFATDGTLLCTVGDAGTDTDAQQSGLKTGRLLRMTEAGGVPADNPLAAPNEYEWCRGLRNSFGLCVHQGSGIFVGTENGPNSNDELNYLGKGKNFEWGATTPVPGAQVGFKMRNWGTVIVPTGVTFHTGAAVPPGYANNLFICSYEDNEILRFEMFGTPPVNINAEHSFATFTVSGNSNKPLDIIQMNDGSLLVSTFTQIWRIYARTGP